TALMPPICVAGFGIANFRWDIFGGAIYLFFINSVFIALSTYAIARFLRFPYVEYVDEGTRKRATRWISVFILLVIIPSGIFFYNLIQKVRIDGNFRAFIEQEVNNSMHEAVRYAINDTDSIYVATLVIAGPPISEDSMAYLRKRLPEYELENFKLNFVQAPQLREEELLSRTTLEVLATLQPMIDSRTARLDTLERIMARQISDSTKVRDLHRELSLLFPEVERMTLSQKAYSLSGQKNQSDTLALVILEWKPMGRTQARNAKKKVEPWLRERLSGQLDSLRVLHL
ncbi:MAG: DUF389 domain-containing protein, partial [Bacteroidota bacterium]